MKIWGKTFYAVSFHDCNHSTFSTIVHNHGPPRRTKYPNKTVICETNVRENGFEERGLAQARIEIRGWGIYAKILNKKTEGRVRQKLYGLSYKRVYAPKDTLSYKIERHKLLLVDGLTHEPPVGPTDQQFLLWQHVDQWHVWAAKPKCVLEQLHFNFIQATSIHIHSKAHHKESPLQLK